MTAPAGGPWGRLLAAPVAVGGAGVPVCETLDAWCGHWRRGSWQQAAPFDTAVLAGFAADRVAWAFAAGVQAALHGLLAARGVAVDRTGLQAFCLTEPAGNRPTDLRTTARPLADGAWQLDGQKQWATLGTACDACLVVAVAGPVPDPGGDAPGGPPGGQRPLQVFRVPIGTAGLSLQPMPATRFMPELPHARLQLTAVRLAADATLPGDGWPAYGKAFRTWEDTLVTAAVLAHLLREARARAWPPAFAEQVLALLLALEAVARQAAVAVDAPATHLGLAGALGLARPLFEQAGTFYAAAAADPGAARWARDAAVLALASGARSTRAARAWQRLPVPGADASVG